MWIGWLRVAPVSHMFGQFSQLGDFFGAHFMSQALQHALVFNLVYVGAGEPLRRRHHSGERRKRDSRSEGGEGRGKRI